MNTQIFYRKATVSRAQATSALFQRFPNADLVSFEAKAADAAEAKAARTKVGEKVYAATIRVAEFPPKDDESSGEEPKKAPEADASSDDDSGSESPDDSGDADAAPDFGGGDPDASPEDSGDGELKGEDLTNHLLQQLVDAVVGGGALGPAGPDPMGGPPPGGDLGLPDIGAPEQGGGLPPPGGPPTPLPPPVKQKQGIGVGSFAHYDRTQSEITVVRRDSHEANNSGLIAEAKQVYPTHRVAKIQRTGSAQINGRPTDLAANKIAVVTLIAN